MLQNSFISLDSLLALNYASSTLTHKSTQSESSLSPHTSYIVMSLCVSAGTSIQGRLWLTVVVATSFRFRTLDTKFTRSLLSRVKAPNIQSFLGETFFLSLSPGNFSITNSRRRRKSQYNLPLSQPWACSS